MFLLQNSTSTLRPLQSSPPKVGDGSEQVLVRLLLPISGKLLEQVLSQADHADHWAHAPSKALKKHSTLSVWNEFLSLNIISLSCFKVFKELVLLLAFLNPPRLVEDEVSWIRFPSFDLSQQVFELVARTQYSQSSLWLHFAQQETSFSSSVFPA